MESREGASEVLRQAFNLRNRESKRVRFGFSTSEDAVTWVVFTYLLRSGQLLTALSQAGLTCEDAAMPALTLFLWGVPVDSNDERGTDIQRRLIELCTKLGEDPTSLSEPDVILDLGKAGLIFVEVKHLSPNDTTPADYRGWTKYSSAAWLNWRIEEIRASGCYELARNWCLLKGLAADRPVTLVNLGPARLFRGAEGARLDRFAAALDTDQRSHFVKVSWSDLLRSGSDEVPEWFAAFCRDRGLIA